jgi:dienelactone hydrolase
VIPFDDAGRTRGQPDAAKTPVAHFGADCRAGLDWLSIHPKVAPVKIGVVGFCIGGHPAAALAMDPKQSSLWLGFLRSGIVNLKDGEVRASYTAADGLGEGRVNDLRFDPDGALWVATEGGLSRLKNGRIAALSGKNGLPCDSVHWVVEDDAHAFWLVTPCGVLRIDRPELEAWAAAVDRDKDAKRTVQPRYSTVRTGVRSRAFAGGYTPHDAKSAAGKIFTTFDGVSVIEPRHVAFNKLRPPVRVEQVTSDRKIYEAGSEGAGSCGFRR